LALAMSRDGSSGGVIRMCVITEDKVERLFVPGDELPKFWEGHEVLGEPAQKKRAVDAAVVPMSVEA
ncbi:Proteasome subunit beta type-6, partial [Termitomyces sp. T159_Od127]